MDESQSHPRTHSCVRSTSCQSNRTAIAAHSDSKKASWCFNFHRTLHIVPLFDFKLLRHHLFIKQAKFFLIRPLPHASEIDASRHTQVHHVKCCSPIQDHSNSFILMKRVCSDVVVLLRGSVALYLISVRPGRVFRSFQLYFEPLHSNLETVHCLYRTLSRGHVVKWDKSKAFTLVRSPANESKWKIFIIIPPLFTSLFGLYNEACQNSTERSYTYIYYYYYRY